MSQSLNFLGLIKDSNKDIREKYIFFYDDESVDKVLEIFDEYTSNKKLSFNRRDAEYLGEKVRKIIKEDENQLDFVNRLEHIFKKYD